MKNNKKLNLLMISGIVLLIILLLCTIEDPFGINYMGRYYIESVLEKHNIISTPEPVSYYESENEPENIVVAEGEDYWGTVISYFEDSIVMRFEDTGVEVTISTDEYTKLYMKDYGMENLLVDWNIIKPGTKIKVMIKEKLNGEHHYLAEDIIII